MLRVTWVPGCGATGSARRRRGLLETPPRQPFLDTSPGSGGAKAVAWGLGRGLVKGTGPHFGAFQCRFGGSRSGGLGPCRGLWLQPWWGSLEGSRMHARKGELGGEWLGKRRLGGGVHPLAPRHVGEGRREPRGTSQAERPVLVMTFERDFYNLQSPSANERFEAGVDSPLLPQRCFRCRRFCSGNNDALDNLGGCLFGAASFPPEVVFGFRAEITLVRFLQREAHPGQSSPGWRGAGCWAPGSPLLKFLILGSGNSRGKGCWR